jgi:hypothetical protein
MIEGMKLRHVDDERHEREERADARQDGAESPNPSDASREGGEEGEEKSDHGEGGREGVAIAICHPDVGEVIVRIDFARIESALADLDEAVAMP